MLGGGRHGIAIVLELAIAAAFYYWGDVPFLPAPMGRQEALDSLAYHEVGLALLAVPVVHASVVFRIRGAVATALCGCAIVLPHTFIYTSYQDPFFGLFSLFLLGGLIGITFNRRDELKRWQGTLEQLISETLSKQESERLYLARELHDATAQDLVDVLHEIDAIQEETADAGAQERLVALRASVESVLDGTRTMMEGLRPAQVDELGLEPSLRWLCEEVQQASGLRVEFDAHGTGPQLSQEQDLAIYRMAQEALTNARRHSQATLVRVVLLANATALRLSISDDGQGFTFTSPDHLARQGKFGLVGLLERARLLGGSASVRSSLGEGTLVTVEMPLRR